MKKTYRLTIDYMMEINEKVKVDGECSRELLEKTQHIINAFLLAPDVLDEFIKYLQDNGVMTRGNNPKYVGRASSGAIQLKFEFKKFINELT